MKSSFNWATFENHWGLLLRNCAKGREEETKMHHSYFMKTQIVQETMLSVNILFLKYKERKIVKKV